MRNWIALAAVVLIAGPAVAQKKPEPPPRFGVPADVLIPRPKHARRTGKRAAA